MENEPRSWDYKSDTFPDVSQEHQKFQASVIFQNFMIEILYWESMRILILFL